MSLVDHLLSRRLFPEKYNCHISEETEVVTFMLFNLSGQFVGYQSYNKDKPKTRNNSTPLEQKYYTYVTGKNDEHRIAIWGLEQYDFRKRLLFVTEGIFDACVFHNFGCNAIAALANRPLFLKQWLASTNHYTVAVCDGDKAGVKLGSITDSMIVLPDGKDANDLDDKDIEFIVNNFNYIK